MLHIGVNLLVLTRHPPAGTGFHAINLFEALVAANQPDIIITGFAARGTEAYFSLKAGAKLHLLPSTSRLDRLANELVRLPLAARASRVDLVLNPAFLGVRWGSPRRSLIIHDLYFRSDPTLVPKRRRWLLRTVTPWLARGSDPLFAVSKATRAQMCKFYPELGQRTKVLVNGNRVLAGAPTPTSPFTRPYLLMVGTLTPNKAPEVVVAALAKLRRSGIDLMLVHIGDDCGRLNPLAAEADISDDVVVLGRQPDNVLRNHYAHALAVVLPSIQEGFGLPLIEAQACGAPIIASNCDALKEVGADAASFFRLDDPSALADAVLTLIADPAHRSDLIERGQRNAARYSWERTAAEFLHAIACTDQNSL